MTFWLLSIAGSSTASTCLLIGASLFFAMKLPSVRVCVGGMGMSLAIAGVVLILVGNYLFNLGEGITGIFGRDTTLTGRTEIWNRVLSQDVNPLVGSGYYSFWMGRQIRTSRGKLFVSSQ